MKTGHACKRILAAFTASALLAVDVHAASTDILNQPLTSSSAVAAKPNILFILDNSGSMASAFMPDDMDDNGRYGYWSSQCNGVAYDPTYTYNPPLKADGTSYGNANFAAAASDGYTYVGSNSRSSSTSVAVATGTITVNIPSASSTSYAAGDAVAITSTADRTIWLSGTVAASGWNNATKMLTVAVTAVSGTGTFSSWDVSEVDNLDGSFYYNYTGAQTRMDWTYNSSGNVQTGTTFYTQCQSNIGSSPGSSVFTLVNVTSASTATLKQNYANWYSYYRTRRLMTRTATGRAFNGLGSSYRVGMSTISDTGATDGTNKFVDVGDFDATKKASFYASLYSATGSSSTPLRGALSKAGRYFANKISGQTSDPMQYSCQRNYAILSTDGYWNTGSESGSYGPYQLTANTNVGQRDGLEVPPMHDGAAAVVITVTPTTTITRKETISTRNDTQDWRRWVYPVPLTTGSGGCSALQYRIQVQRQGRTQTMPNTIDSIDDFTTVVTNTVVTTNGVVTSNTNSTTNSTANVSSSTTSGTSSYNSWTNGGGTTTYCRTAAQLTAAGMLPGGTFYSSTGCGGSCTYTGIASTADGVVNGGVNTGALNSGTPTVLSVNGPTVGTPVVTNSTSGGSSNSLADVAEYYYNTDLRDASLSNCTSGSSGNNVCSNATLSPLDRDTATHQHLTTYTIGLGVNGTLAYDSDYLNQVSGAYVQLKNGTLNWPVPVETGSGGDARQIDDLWHAAVNGRGRYFATSNATTLANAVSGALQDAVKVVGSASGAATNSLEPVAGDNNQAYIATYTTFDWTGDVKSYPLDATTGTINTTTATWSAKTQLEAIGHASRNIKYRQPGTGAMRDFNFANLNTDGYGTHFTNFCSKATVPSQCAALTAGQVTSANSGSNLVDFLRGNSAYEASTNLVDPLYRERAAKLGDIINGSPVYVKKPPLKYTDAGYSTFATAQASRTAMLYVPANDGMLHALDAATGNEQWAYVPSFVMPSLYRLADTNFRNNHGYSVDGTPVVGDIYVGGSWKTILVGGLNSGGRGFYALDITNPGTPLALWEFTDANMGLSYGNPIITKKSDGTWVVAVTSGLNNTSGDGLGHLYVLNANTGAVIQNLATTAGSAATPSGLAKLNVWIDDATSNTVKRFYGGDMLGNLWRFDTEDLIAPSGAEATLLATFQLNVSTPQPITTVPQTALITQAGNQYPVIVVGTGRYLGLTDIDDTTQQSIYAVKDTLGASGHGDVRLSSALVSQTVTAGTSTSTGTSNAVDWATKIGWKLDLPLSKERIVTDMALQFNTLVAASAIPGANECNPAGGKSWLYAININNGGAADSNGVLGQFLGDFLVVGMTWIKTSSGESKIEIVGSDASVHTKNVPPPGEGTTKVRRSSWRELIN